MHNDPILMVKPVVDILNRIIRDYGLYLYLVMVWLSPFLIAWILVGGFRRRSSRHRSAAGIQVIIIHSMAAPPPLPPVLPRPPVRSPNDDDSQSFAA